jgi:hypothetical protein
MRYVRVLQTGVNYIFFALMGFRIRSPNILTDASSRSAKQIHTP